MVSIWGRNKVQYNKKGLEKVIQIIKYLDLQLKFKRQTFVAIIFSKIVLISKTSFLSNGREGVKRFTNFLQITSEIAFTIYFTDWVSSFEKANHFLPKSFKEAPK